MTVPLIILATFALFAASSTPALAHQHAARHWLEPVFEAAPSGGRASKRRARAGIVHGRSRSRRRRVRRRHRRSRTGCTCRRRARPREALAEQLPGLLPARPRQVARRRALRRDRHRHGRLARRRLRAGSTSGSSTASSRASRRWSSRSAGTVLRAFQTGVVQVYAAIDGRRPRRRSAGSSPCRTPTRTSTRDDADGRLHGHRGARASATRTAGTRTATASPDTDDFGAKTTRRAHARRRAESQTVKLEVKNAFGRVRSTDHHVARPAPKCRAEPQARRHRRRATHAPTRRGSPAQLPATGPSR